MKPDVIIILSSGIIPYWENTLSDISYKLTTYEHYDNFGTLGGRDRACAGAIAAQKFTSAKIIVTSARAIEGAPSHAEVMRNELILLGVNASRIILEKISTNLSSQITESIKISTKNQWLNLLFITSEFHVPRTRLMVEIIASDQLKSVKVSSSESILIPNDRNFSIEFQKIKNNKQYTKRIENEERGIKAIKEGIYLPAPRILKKEKCDKSAILILETSSGLGESFFKNLHGKEYDVLCLSRRFLPYQEEISQNNNSTFLINYDPTKLNKFIDNLKKLKQCLMIYKKIVFINHVNSILPVRQTGSFDNVKIVSNVNRNYRAPILIKNMLLTLSEVEIKVLNISLGPSNNPLGGWSIYCSATTQGKIFSDDVSLRVINNISHSVNNSDPDILDTKLQVHVRNYNYDNFSGVNEFIDLNNRGGLLDLNDVADKVINKYIL